MLISIITDTISSVPNKDKKDLLLFNHKYKNNILSNHKLGINSKSLCNSYLI